MIVFGRLFNTLSIRNAQRDSVTVDFQPNNLSQQQVVIRHSSVTCSWWFFNILLYDAIWAEIF